jgi:hypothetical protein
VSVPLPSLPKRVPGSTLPPGIALAPQPRYVGRASVPTAPGRYANDTSTMERLARALRRPEV